MASSNDEVRVPIALPVETNAADAAASVDELADRIARSKDAIREAATNMRNFSGKTAEMKAAKDQLKATIDKERAAINQSAMALQKQGKSYDKIARAKDELKKKDAEAAKTREADRVKAIADAHKKALEARAKYADKIAKERDLAKQAAAGNTELATSLVAGVAVAALAAAAAVAGLVVALAKWAIRGADAARSMQLVREASTISAVNARNLGMQVDALASKVPTSTEKLNELAASLARSGLGGQTVVDTLNAVAQASAAIDDSAGAKMREIVERGKLTQRMFIGLRELQGTGLDFTDVAASLAEGMHVSVKKAQAALVSGRVKLEDGAKALRDAVEKKFGGINIRKMMSLEGLAETLKKKFAAMTSGIDLEPASRAMFKFLSVFDESTATGAVLKRAVTAFGQGMVSIIERGAPIAKEFIRGLIIGGLKLYIAYLQVKKAFNEAFGDSELFKNVDWLQVALDAGQWTVTALAVGLGVLAAATVVAVAPFVWLGTQIYDVVEAGVKFTAWLLDIGTKLANLDWKKTGLEIIDGLISGLSDPTRLVEAIKNLATKAKDSFKNAMGIHSPSTVFAEFGKHTTAGYAKGVESSKGDAEGAVAGMVAPPRVKGALGAGGGGGATITVNATIVLSGGEGKSASEQIQDPGFLAQLTKTFKEAAAAAGISATEAPA